jgi:hypothetical protein
MNNNALLIILVVLFFGIISVMLTIGVTTLNPADLFSDIAQSEEPDADIDAYNSASVK